MKRPLLTLTLVPIAVTLTGCVPTGTLPAVDPPEVQLFESLAAPWCAAVDADTVLLSDIGKQLAAIDSAYADTGLLETEIARGSSRTVRDYLDLTLPVLSQDSTNAVTREQWGDEGYDAVVAGDCKFFTGLSALARE